MLVVPILEALILPMPCAKICNHTMHTCTLMTCVWTPQLCAIQQYTTGMSHWWIQLSRHWSVVRSTSIVACILEADILTVYFILTLSTIRVMFVKFYCRFSIILSCTCPLCDYVYNFLVMMYINIIWLCETACITVWLFGFAPTHPQCWAYIQVSYRTNYSVNGLCARVVNEGKQK